MSQISEDENGQKIVGLNIDSLKLEQDEPTDIFWIDLKNPENVGIG